MSVLLLQDVKNYLNITNTVSDAELQEFIDAAELSIANKCGPLVATSVTKRVRSGGKPALSLPTTPVISLTSVTPVGQTALDVSKLNADEGGAVEYLTGATFGALFYDVVWQAGYATTPLDLLQATKEHVRHLWESQQGGTRRPGSTTQPAPSAAAYAFTWRVNELIAPYLQAGIA